MIDDSSDRKSLNPPSTGLNKSEYKWISWRELRMEGMLTVVNDALAPHGFAISAIVEDGLDVAEDRSEDVITAMPLRTIDGSSIERF